MFLLYLYLGGRNALDNLEICCNGLVEGDMLDSSFQFPAEENLISLEDLVRKIQLYRRLILLSTGLGGLDGMN